jgi:uncharacterized protein YheU (UPF0270 family)
VLELLDAETDDLVLDDFLRGEQRVDVGQVERQLDQVLARLRVVHLLPQGGLLLQEEVRIGRPHLENLT